MRKICYVTTVPGTIKSFILDLAKYFAETKKYDITFICSADELFANNLPNEFHYIPIKIRRGIDMNSIGTVIQLRKIFKENKFDYIQYSTPNASFYSAIALFGINDPVKVYAQWGIRYTGANGIERCMLKMFEKITCKLTPNIRAVSKKNMEFAIRERLYTKNKVKVIGNGGTIGVDMAHFDISKKDDLRKSTRDKYNIADNCFVFGFIGRINRDKGSNELLSAFKKIDEKAYNSKLILVGGFEASKGMDINLINWAKECDDVIIAGSFPKNELPAFYAAFDCYVHPTYREGFGMVLQEAGAMGNAIITTDVPGASEVMEDNISCKLVSSKNDQALFEMMEYMIQNPSAAEKIGEEAYIRTKNLYERSIMINNISKDIEELLGE